jgi:hypothetical protein
MIVLPDELVKPIPRVDSASGRIGSKSLSLLVFLAAEGRFVGKKMDVV